MNLRTRSNAALTPASQASANTAGPSNPLPEPLDDNRTMEEELQSSYDEESRRIPKAESQTWDPSTKINANFYKVGLSSEAQILKYSATDYDSFIVSNKPLGNHDLSTIGCSIPTPHTRSGPDGNPIAMKYSLSFLGLVNVKALIDHVKSKNTPLDHAEEELKFLNIISWKKVNSPQYEGGRVGKKFYPHSFVADDERWMSQKRTNEQKDPTLRFKDKVPLYQIHRGFFSSMRPGQGSVLLNVNVTTSAFFSPINLAKWIESNPNAWGDSGRLLKGVRVVFDIHEKNRRKVFNINSIAPRSVSETKFTKDGTEVSVHTYVNATYHETVFDKNARCINVGSKVKPTWFPADHLEIVEWQIFKKDIPEPYVAAMIAATKRPRQSKFAIKETGLAELGFFEKSPFYKTFGVIPDTKFVEIKVGALAAPTLLLRGTDKSPACDGAWEMKFKQCQKPGIENTTLYVLWLRHDKIREQNEMEEATHTLARSLERFGFNQVKERVFCQAIVPEEKVDSAVYRQTCSEAFEKALGSVFKDTRKVPLIMVVLPERNSKLYPEIERWGDCDKGIPTVCVVEKNLSGGADRARCGNISLKFNLKLGGINQEVRNGCGTMSQTMVFGADVTHPGNEEGCPSIAVVVATDDDSRFQYLGSARIQEGKKERHHAGYYPLTLEPGDPNLGAGTIIDSVVVTPNHFSFYLQSHCNPLGTAKSTQYVVIYDYQDYKTNPKNIMNITNKLCYTGARASKALSVCTPARYADMLCDCVRCYLKPVLKGYRDAGSTDDVDGTQRAAIYEENKLLNRKLSELRIPLAAPEKSQFPMSRYITFSHAKRTEKQNFSLKSLLSLKYRKSKVPLNSLTFSSNPTATFTMSILNTNAVFLLSLAIQYLVFIAFITTCAMAVTGSDQTWFVTPRSADPQTPSPENLK
ncbi:hypothetical protein BHYA_0220g00100 [Botrytis hyacinthi]|uniref:Piwi domain-containing protein n=1 Tax=Botrytis hyacinthi TaxID=278943 RepID=A0A4Z1GAV7_9HELO|nr:hypothetical protein BHYA_0220g00100 [Botrytis hyacinthi]